MALSGVFGNVFGDGDHAPTGEVTSGIVYNNGGLTGTKPTAGSPNYPTEAQVLDGILFGTSGAEEYTGNVTLPTDTDVRLNITYGPNNGDIAGLLDVNAEANLPTESQVLIGVTFGATNHLNGNVTLPSVNDVRLSTTFGSSLASTGNVRVPPVDKVEVGYVYDTNDTLTGTLDPGAGGTVPNANDVRFGTAVGATTGLLVVPATTNVRNGVTYDAAAVEQEGVAVIPAAGDVRSGVAVDVSPAVGTLDIDAEANLPPEDSVLVGTVYGVDSSENGNYTTPNNSHYDVSGPTYGASASITGTLTLPLETQVISAIPYGPDGSDLVGEYVEPLVSDVVERGTYGPTNSITGQFAVPLENVVATGETYGYQSEFTGTFAGVVPTYPLQSQVLDGVAYGDAGNALTGNYVEVATNNVLQPITYGSLSSKTGLLYLPSENNVELGIPFGVSNVQYTGNVTVPTEADVRNLTTYGSLLSRTGVLDPGGAPDYPSINDVRNTVSFDFGNLVGNLVVPTESQVLLDVGYDSSGTAATGNIVLPPLNTVAVGTSYGPLSALDGELVILTPTYPLESNVLNNIAYGDQNDSFTGNYVVVTESNVRSPINYGSNSSQQGTLIALSPSYPQEDKVLAGINYGDQVESFTGDYVVVATNNVRDGVFFGSQSSLQGNVELPAVEDVANGVGYGTDGTELYGTLLAGGYPSQDDVQNGVNFGASNEFVGNFQWPTEPQVLKDIGYGSNGTEFLGELESGAPVVDMSGYNPFG